MSLAVSIETSFPPADLPSDLERLFRDHGGRVYRAALRVTGSSADAEDVVQTVFVRLLRREEEIVLRETAGSYLYRAAINCALDLLRMRARARASDLDDAAELESGEQTRTGSRLERRELHQHLRRAPAALHPRTAQIFALRYFEGFGNTEIAEMLGTTRSSIAVTLHRVRNHLKTELGPELGASS